ncbi:MAG: hypothetical protein Q4C01_03910 [Clostridia bacterium]|nr:hypothetical protein [Clostridia bacterium]
MKCTECTCKEVELSNWIVVWDAKSYHIVMCLKCEQAWKTTAKYTSELVRDYSKHIKRR